MFSENGDRSMTPVLSLSSSILTSAFMSAQMSHEWDSSEENRKIDPTFYGYLPKSLTRRCFLVLQMFLLATFSLVLRALSFVILAQRSIYAVAAVFGGELALFFLIKVARNDCY